MASYSMISSARASSCGGTSTPSALAGAGINHQLELRRQLNRQVARFFALEDATCIDAQDPIALVGIRSIAHQSPDSGKFTAEVHGSHPMPRCKHDDLSRTIEKERIDRNGKG